MAKTIFNGTYGLADESQQVVRCARVEFGPDASTSKGVVFNTTGVHHLLWLPAGAVILQAMARVITAWATGQALIIGDSTQTDGLFLSATLAPTTAVTTGILKSNSVSDYFNATGKLGGYAIQSARYINVIQDDTGATKMSTASTGKAELFVVYSCNSAD